MTTIATLTTTLNTVNAGFNGLTIGTIEFTAQVNKLETITQRIADYNEIMGSADTSLAAAYDTSNDMATRKVSMVTYKRLLAIAESI